MNWFAPLCLASAALAVLGACAPSPRPSVDAILESLPLSAAGEDLSGVRVIDSAFPSGHVVDDVLAALGKQRSQASVVFRFAPEGHGYLGGIAVDGVGGAQLVEVIGSSWLPAAVLARSQHSVGGHDGVLLTFRDGSELIAYNAGTVVYLAYTDDPRLTQEYIAALPQT